MSEQPLKKLTPELPPSVELPAPLPPAEREPMPESEREHLKTQVLKEIEAQDHPKKAPAPTLTTAPLKSEPVVAKSKTLLEIEQVLEVDLRNTYFTLEPRLQQRFKAEGETTARAIERILLNTKEKTESKVRQIILLISNWLKLLPGVNQFFIKQEAKIKTEKILKLR